VLGNRGQTKAEFSRKEHGKDAHTKARAHLKSKYDEYMKEEILYVLFLKQCFVLRDVAREETIRS
jgi:hypothetical protein